MKSCATLNEDEKNKVLSSDSYNLDRFNRYCGYKGGSNCDTVGLDQTGCSSSACPSGGRDQCCSICTTYDVGHCNQVGAIGAPPACNGGNCMQGVYLMLKTCPEKQEGCNVL